MKQTDNYGLVLYDKEDKFDITSEKGLNASMKKIDKTLKEKATIEDMTNYIEEHKEELKGKDGVNGKDGYTPVKGVDYFDGKDGKNGEDGKDYVLTETDKEDISKLVEVNIPTKVSELENDKNYLSSVPLEYVTETELTKKSYATESFVANKIAEAELSGSEVDLSGLATKDELASKVDKVKGKSLIDDTEIERLKTVTNYDDTEIKNSINSKADKTELHSHNNKTVLDNITAVNVENWNNKSEFDGNYNSLSNKPTIPSKVSELSNDKGFISSIPSEYVTETELNNKKYLTSVPSDYKTKTENDSLYQTKGNYLTSYTESDPTVPSHVKSIKSTDISNWNNKSEFSGNYNDLTNKPTLFSGSYNDLTNKPTIPTVPSNISAFNNDKGYLTSVPSEYITETELSAKNYATKSELHSHSNKSVLDNTTASYTTEEKTKLAGLNKDEIVEDVISKLPSDDGLPIAMEVTGYVEGSSSKTWHNIKTSGGLNSGYVEIVSGYKYIKALVKANQYVFAVIFFNANKSALYEPSVIGDSRTGEYLVEIPSDAKYVIVSHWTPSGDSGVSYSAYFSNGDTLKKVTELEERVDVLEDEIGNKANAGDMFDGVEFSLFKQWGVVGDSLSVGHTADTDGNASSPNYYYSWGQYLARRIGNKCLHFGRSGVSAKAWMTTEKGYPELIKAENLCQAYILALGANDTEFTLGSISDIDFSNMDNNAETEYGYYAKVINAIRTTAPQAPIFLFTLAYPRNTDTKVQAINGMIRELASNSNFTNVYLVDLDADYNEYFAEGKLYNCIGNTGWHLTALGYLYTSHVIEMAISGVMAENAGDFQNVFEIPYGETITDTTTTTSETWTFELEDGTTVTKSVVVV